MWQYHSKHYVQLKIYWLYIITVDVRVFKTVLKEHMTLLMTTPNVSVLQVMLGNHEFPYHSQRVAMSGEFTTVTY